MPRNFDLGKLYRYNGRWTPEFGREPEILAGGPKLELLGVYVTRADRILGDGNILTIPDGPNNPVVIVEKVPSYVACVAGDYICYEVYKIGRNEARAWFKRKN